MKPLLLLAVLLGAVWATRSGKAALYDVESLVDAGENGDSEEDGPFGDGDSEEDGPFGDGDSEEDGPFGDELRICSGAELRVPNPEVSAFDNVARHYVWSKKGKYHLTASFLNDPPKYAAAEKRAVKRAAQEWANAKDPITGEGSDLTIEFVEGAAAHTANIRIRFNWDSDAPRSYSEIGTLAKKIPKGLATMEFGWPVSTSKKAYSTALHEFGHALGLLHEHQHPKRMIRFNHTAVDAYYGGPPRKWSPQRIYKNIYWTPKPQHVTGQYDEKSIMYYYFPRRFLINAPKGVGGAITLSKNDRAAVVRHYSRPKD